MTIGDKIRIADSSEDVSVPMLQAIASARGIEIGELVDKILAKADAMKVAVGSILGNKQKEVINGI